MDGYAPATPTQLRRKAKGVAVASCVDDDSLRARGLRLLRQDRGVWRRSSWYLASRWNTVTGKRFERRLRWVRSHKRAMYLRLQGEALVMSDDQADVTAGRNLLHRAIREEPKGWDAFVAWRTFGRRYARDACAAEAIDAFRQSLRLARWLPERVSLEMELAWVLVEAGTPDNVLEAVTLLGAVEREVPVEAFRPATRFHFYLIAARAAAIQEIAPAGTYARRALDLANDLSPRPGDPAFDRLAAQLATRVKRLEEVSAAYPEDVRVETVLQAFGLQP